jgi:hypothetical protein
MLVLGFEVRGIHDQRAYLLALIQNPAFGFMFASSGSTDNHAILNSME